MSPGVLRETASPAAFDADSTLTYLESPARRAANKVIATIGLGAYAMYLAYRVMFTINPQALGFSLLVLFAEIHGFFSLFFYFFQTWELRGRAVPPPPEELTVDVFITTYNEDVDLLRQTVRGAMAMRYPHETYILDDGRRAEVKALADELGCQYVTRSTNEHAKAGNWNNAFQRTTGDVIATFDADHVPRADFLLRTLGFFRDPKVALVQVPQRYHNVDSLQHRINWKIRRMYGEQDVFFNLVCPGKDHWNASFFCGTGAVLRRAALAPRGGLETGSITEDMHTSLALHAGGWKSVYVDELLVTGLAPMDFAGFQAQRLRWAEGNLKIIRAINPLTHPGLTVPQRICYFASMYHWTVGLPKLIFYLSPPWMLFTGSYPIANFGVTFLCVYGMFLAALVYSYKALSRGHGRLVMDELFNMATTFTLNQALKRLIFGRGKPSKFVVTDKRGGARSVKEVIPHFALVAFSMLAVEWGVLSLQFGVIDDGFGLGVSMFWVLYNLVLMALVIEMALRPVQKRLSCRFTASLPVVSLAGAPNGDEEVGMTTNLSAGGCELLWPRPLEVGSELPIRLIVAGDAIECRGVVTAAFRRRKGPWYAHGLAFSGMDARATDFLNDALFNLVVPRLFDQLAQPSLFARAWHNMLKRLRHTYLARPKRQLISVPVRLDIGPTQIIATTHDMSATGVGVIVSRPMPVGAEVAMTVLGADRRSIALTVARCRALPAPTPEFQTWLVGFHVEGESVSAAHDCVLKAAA
jgi:cellulose synthase/poly-beta-1,6-N-acetylglucosamine synthase-like glycosyltransferase